MQTAFNFIGEILKWGWIVFLTFSLVVAARQNKDWPEAYKRIKIGLMFEAVGLIIVVLLTFAALYLISPDIFGFNIFTAIFWVKDLIVNFFSTPQTVSGGNGGGFVLPQTTPFGSTPNLNFVATTVPVLGVFFCVLLLICIPNLTHQEEKWFREGTTDWKDGIKRSIKFGLVHLTVGIPIGAALALILVGLYLTRKYFKGGIQLSWQLHFQYDLLLIFVLFIGTILSSLAWVLQLVK